MLLCCSFCPSRCVTREHNRSALRLLMDFDPDFEFDAPRWFDFSKDDDGFSSNDSWFENDHPLHEPKVPQEKRTSGTQKRPPGGRKRRLLPAIPQQKKKPEINNPMSHGTAATTKVHKSRPKGDARKPNQSTAPIESNTLISPCLSETSPAAYEDTCTHNSAITEPIVSAQSDDYWVTSPSRLRQRSDGLSCASELPSLALGRKDRSAAGAKQPSLPQGELSVEEMLKMHNRKIMATKCKYDENGRKIKSGTPTFCPAPDKGTKTVSRIRAKQKSAVTALTQPSSNASPIASASSKKLAQCRKGVNLLSTSKREKEADVHVPIRVPTPDLLMQSNESTSTAVTKDNGTGPFGGKESGALTQTTKRQAKQASAAKLSCPDNSSKHVITGQKRAGSSAEGTQASAKQKRRSCMPSIGVNANTGVLQMSSGTRQNEKGVRKCPTKQKRRSCMAGIQKSSVSNADKELEELIQRHNSQIVAKKS